MTGIILLFFATDDISSSLFSRFLIMTPPLSFIASAPRNFASAYMF